MVRFKYRYLLVELSCNQGNTGEPCTDNVLLQALRDSVLQNFGDYGYSRSLISLLVKYYSPYTGLAIVRCATAELQTIITSLALLTKIKNQPASVRVVRVAGTLATCKEAATRLSETKLVLMKLEKRGSTSHQQLGAAEELHRHLQAVEI